jgi:type VI secretion system secreted protein VgrG
LIYQVAQAESGNRLTCYKLSIVPQLSYLALRTNQRIFQHLTVPQIVAQVSQEHGIVEGGYQFLLGPTVYPTRDYCVHYDESDLHFVQRLCEEEGIHYHFQHSAKGHALVLDDDQGTFGKFGQPAALTYMAVRLCAVPGDRPLHFLSAMAKLAFGQMEFFDAIELISLS